MCVSNTSFQLIVSLKSIVKLVVKDQKNSSNFNNVLDGDPVKSKQKLF